MSSIIRWLHLSDFHVGKDSYEQQRLFAEILGEVDRWMSEKKFVPDYVFITGDIANKGLKKEYETFRKEFLVPLQNKFDADTVIIPVPGNHDVERPTTDTLDRTAPLAASSRFFDANRDGKADRAPVVRRFNNYKKLMPASGMSPDWLISNEGTATHTRQLAGVNIGVVGLNTAWLCKDGDDKGRLTPGYRLVEAVLKKIETCQIKIVLGHHPLSWWNDNEETNIRRLFAQHHVLYLHGHKHKSEGRFEEGGVDQFLVLQAGAAFQAREHEQWVNGFSLGELDPAAAEVRISPRYWVNGEWPPDMSAITLKRRIDETDWWLFPLPGMPTLTTSMAQRADRLSGWMELDAGMMASFAREVTSADAQRFFDGAEPDWALATSPHFSVRAQAKALLESVANFKGEDRPQIALVRGPTAEGKSMTLRQIVVAALRTKPDLKVLWHQDDTAGINVQAFEETLLANTPYLIATDHGDMIVQDLEKLAQRLKRSGRGNVQVILAAHDSDWRIAKGETVRWYSFAQFEEARLSGLSKEDATSLAMAWHHFGAVACDTSLQSLPLDLLAEQLLQAAKDDGSDEGALFGALLTLRHGKDLRAHVRTLLQRLDAIRRAPPGTVGEAFRLVAAMHAEGLNFLSSKVLQEAMGCDHRTIQTEMLRPMAAEAVISGGSYLRTRHRRIAKATLEICSEDDEDVDQLYVSLLEAALRFVRIKGGWIDVVRNWEYTLTKHFFDAGRVELAIRLAEKMLEIDPENSHYAVNLARLKRESGDTRGAAKILQMATPPRDDRVFWREWGTVCGVLGDNPSSALLRAYSITDNLTVSAPTVDDLSHALGGLAKVFEELHIKRGHFELERARAACAWMGLIADAHNKILKDHQQASAHVGNPKDIAEGILWLCVGLTAAIGDEQLAESVAEKVGNPAQFKFERLHSLLELSHRSKAYASPKDLA